MLLLLLLFPFNAATARRGTQYRASLTATSIPAAAAALTAATSGRPPPNANHDPPSTSSSSSSGRGVAAAAVERVSGAPVHCVRLRSSDPDSVWCYAASATAGMISGGVGGGAGGCDATPTAGAATIPPPSTAAANFLATQVWPSSRAASRALMDLLHASGDGDDGALAEGGDGGDDQCMTICELGCGPGLPSLAAAKFGNANGENGILRTGPGVRVLATDLDPFALRLVEAAAERQGAGDAVTTAVFDLTGADPLPPADLYVMSDVFESFEVARGAARHTRDALLGIGEEGGGAKTVWVFAQSDRAQREAYLTELRRLCGDVEELRGAMEWSSAARRFRGGDGCGGRAAGRLWLCDVDETLVEY